MNAHPDYYSEMWEARRERDAAVTELAKVRAERDTFLRQRDTLLDLLAQQVRAR